MAERKMPDQHRSAIAVGRIEASAVRDYLEALETRRADIDRRTRRDRRWNGPIEDAAAYGQRSGSQYAIRREAGVPADLLARAGITRGQ